ncbi:MAG: hypothetical protein QM791_21250 [Ferruginibacter sp.]
MSYKITILLTLLLFQTSFLFAQLNKFLCKQNEEIVFAFQLKNQKWVSVCKEKKEKYLVYRFGTATKIELQYPQYPDTSSWQLFSFNGYMRGGGKQNAAMNYAYLKFMNNDVVSEIYKTWDSFDNKKHCGLTVTVKEKQTKITGLVGTMQEDLLSLIYNDKIKKYEEE